MNKIRIMIADDNEVVREGLESLLVSHEDINIVAKAVDGLDAVNKAKQFEPDVILMDAQMPNLDGPGATRRIKEILPETKILFLTVYGDYVGDALAAGASWYLTKDCRRQDLLEAIRTLATSKRSKAQKK
ncbi:MAG TPA: response regulator transcription factor [Dehalococcoidia bacterium]|nr:response regulator transcription factor [Dehalococcoidia bacterium]